MLPREISRFGSSGGHDGFILGSTDVMTVGKLLG
jgi:hypothetical protein